jgi:hypothetical protein
MAGANLMESERAKMDLVLVLDDDDDDLLQYGASYVENHGFE